MTQREAEFRVFIRALLRIKVKPTPTTINRFLGRNRSRMNNINGREAH